MAPIKRKSGPTNESFIRTEPPGTNEQRPSKRARQEKSAGKPPKPADVEFSVAPREKGTNLSRGGEEDTAFPRGGASLLTPLEHKQIQIDATRDVLFEQQGTLDAETTLDDGNPRTLTQSTPGKHKKSSRKGKEKFNRPESEAEKVRIEGLNYKRLVPGSVVLGQVYQINTDDIALALPNNLIGYVPITSISDGLTERIERLAVLEDQKDVENDEHTGDIDLEAMFSIGQYLRGYVVSTSEAIENKPAEKGKRRIELSLRPLQANTGLSLKDLVPYSTVMASISSVEDHGLIMDLGLNGHGVRGFMSSRELPHDVTISNAKEGAVYLCMITGLSSNGKTIKLTGDVQKFASLKKSNYLAEAPTVDAFLPGTAVEFLVTDVTHTGLAGKVMGMLNVTADLMHSGVTASVGQTFEKKYKLGDKVKGRITCTFPASESLKVGISLLDHVISLAPQQTQQNGQYRQPLDVLPLSTIVEEVTVKRVESGVGLFVDVGVKRVPGFVHISRITDGKIEVLSESSGAYQPGSVHRGRIIGYNSIDGVFLVSLEQKTLDQAFLRVEDLNIGEVVKGKVEKLVVNAAGVGGLLVNLSEGITGLVSEMHMADVSLLHPEKKFREGMKVVARVLSTDPGKRKIRLTLKKTLVNSEAAPLKSYSEITPGMQSPGTIVNILPAGAVVQFYGTIRGFLPVSEMSEAFIKDPAQHFRVGQVVNVHVLSVYPEGAKLTVSCKDPSAFGLAQQNALKDLKIGERVSATVQEKSNDDITVALSPSNLRAILPVGHLTDGSSGKSRALLKIIRVGQVLHDLVVLDRFEQKHLIVLTNKPSLLEAAKNQSLLRDFEDVKEDKVVHGFVKNITLSAVFVQFGGGLTGLLPKTRLPNEALRLPDFGLQRLQSITTRIVSVDHGARRFLLSAEEVKASGELVPETGSVTGPDQALSNPVDQTIKFIGDLVPGRLTSARVISVKETQINVQLADNIQGRVDVSQVFDSWEDIKDRKRPLRNFASKQVIPVRVLGVHDARNHRFLPISHRIGRTFVFELSAKPSHQTDVAQTVLTLHEVKKGSSWIAYVNNVREDCLWVNLSPNIRGRIGALDISDDVTLLQNLDANFPVGSAIRVRVIGVNISDNRLDLSARSAQATEELTIQTLSKGMVLLGRVTKVTNRQIMVQLSDGISGPINLTDLTDDYSEANPAIYAKNEIVRVCVSDVDIPYKRLRLSTRPSRVLNSSLSVKDPEIISISQLNVNDVVRGFIKNVADNGIFVNLGGDITAYVRVSDLSDSYLKDWKSFFQVDQLVKGKVIQLDAPTNHLQLSLKASIIDKNYIAPLNFNDLKVGQIVTGKIRKVEDFGVFIVIDGSSNVSGLCHRSEMAESKVDDVKSLYHEGDVVKTVILKLDPEKRRISFGLKASYLDNGSDSEDEEDDNSEIATGAMLEDDQSDSADSEGEALDPTNIASLATEEDKMSQASDELRAEFLAPDVKAVNVGGFDWTASILDDLDQQSNDDLGGENHVQKKKRRKPTIQVDRTGELDVDGPQSVSDFERLLLGRPDSSRLWIEYMAFQMKLSELASARAVAERALRTINVREETEKMNVWVALLNLENAYGNDETVEEVFKRACQYNDAQEIHERLTSIYIQSGKLSKADDLFQILVKKFSQSPAVWYNYAHFLHQEFSSPDRARALLPRAIQSLPSYAHLNLTIKFAALEFHSPNGSPERGRTMFEGLLSTFPKRLDIWNQLLDLEVQQGDQGIIRGIFERVVKTKGLKPKGAKALFRRWGDWEEKHGNAKTQERVRANAEEWVRSAVEKKALNGPGDDTV
ncbi:MAG: rRNA biogenesis protein rrp5 [Claussenomyces sp. TS43310]|nr:MAG: rRNA biogenesis protein rrp5 [Claussenomyces sp. TS43310]